MSCNGCGGTPALLGRFLSNVNIVKIPQKNPFDNKSQSAPSLFTNSGKFVKFTREKK